MDTLGFEPRAFRMRSGCDTTTPCAPERSGRQALRRCVLHACKAHTALRGHSGELVQHASKPHGQALHAHTWTQGGTRHCTAACASWLSLSELGSWQYQTWAHWDLNPGPSACETDVIPLHHVPLRCQADKHLDDLCRTRAGLTQHCAGTVVNWHDILQSPKVKPCTHIPGHRAAHGTAPLHA